MKMKMNRIPFYAIPFGNRIELFRPYHPYLPKPPSTSVHPTKLSHKPPQIVYPPWIPYKDVEGDVAASPKRGTKWWHYPPECIEWAIRKRVTPNIATGVVAWKLLEQFGAAYGVEIVWVHGTPMDVDDTPDRDTDGAFMSSTINSAKGKQRVQSDDFDYDYESDCNTCWYIWIDTHLTPLWASLAWDYMSSASGWAEDRLLFENTKVGVCFEENPDFEILEEMANEAWETAVQLRKRLDAKRVQPEMMEVDTEDDQNSEIDFEQSTETEKAQRTEKLNRRVDKLMRARLDDPTAGPDSDDSESSSGGDELSVREMMRWDCIERREMEARMRMNEFRTSAAYQVSVGPRPRMSGPGRLPEMPNVDFAVFGMREPATGVKRVVRDNDWVV
jgi:hypothetical protein